MTVEPREPLDDYEAIRRRLRERGYLGGRLERFVLEDAIAGPLRARRLWRAALKAALMGGPLLGALLAGFVAALHRPPFGAADLTILALYLGLAGVVVLFAVNLLTALFVVALGRLRGARPGDTTTAALLAAIPTLGYLAVLWWQRGAHSGLGADLLFLALSLAVALLVAWLAGLVSLTGIIGRTGRVPDRGRRAVWLVLVGVMVPLGAALLLARGTVSARDVRPESAPFEPREAAPLLLVGVDGLDGALVQAFEPRGTVAGLLERFEAGAVFPLSRRAGAEPAEVWTTAMTGMPAGSHGVQSAGSQRLAGVATPLSMATSPAPLEAAVRFLLPTRTVPTAGRPGGVRALWEIVALKRAAVAVSWWGSWPVPTDPPLHATAYVVSDRVLPKLLSDAPEDRDAAPASLFARLRAEFADDRRRLREEYRSRFAPVDGPAAAWVWESFLIDAYALRVAERLRGDPAVRAVFIYLPGLDILRHRLAGRADSDGVAGLLETQELLERYVGWVDAALARLRRELGDWHQIVVADPGRGPAGEGFVAVTGARARPGCVGGGRSLLDVAPLALELLGFPSSEEMAGGLPGSCLDPGPGPRRRVATFGRRPTAGETRSSEYDAEMVERLRSLGYLK